MTNGLDPASRQLACLTNPEVEAPPKEICAFEL